AIAIVQVAGDDADRIIATITRSSKKIETGAIKKVSLAGIDEGVVAKISENSYQLMPHGGRRVVQRLIDELVKAGAVYNQNPKVKDLYPEADSAIEADALEYAAKTASPLALDILAAQPQL